MTVGADSSLARPRPARAVSVIIPTLERPAALRRALGSVRRESKDVEIVVVDGSASTRSAGLCAEFGAELISEPDDGIADAWNKGIAACSGELIVLLNDDDALMPGALTDVDPGEMAGIEGAAVVDHGDVCRRYAPTGGLRLEQILLGPLMLNARFWVREALDELGPFDGAFGLAADREFALRAMLAGHRFRVVDRPLYAYLTDHGSRTFAPSLASLARMHDDQQLLCRRVASHDPATARRASAATAAWYSLELLRRRQVAAGLRQLRAVLLSHRRVGDLVGWFLGNHRRRGVPPETFDREQLRLAST